MTTLTLSTFIIILILLTFISLVTGVFYQWITNTPLTNDKYALVTLYVPIVLSTIIVLITQIY